MAQRLTRGELYELVWSRPIERLVTQFEISDVALAEACRSIGIPVPRRGYWAKLQAGKKVMRSPLPPRGPGTPDEVFVGGRPYRWYEVSNEDPPLPPEFPEDIRETRKRALKITGKIKVQDSLAQPPPLIGRLLEEDDERRKKKQSSTYSWDKPLFEVQ